MDKNKIRQTIRKKRLDLDEETFLLYSSIIIETLLQQPVMKEAKTIGLYVSCRHEVDTHRLIDRLNNCRLAVPKVEGQVMSFYRIDSLADTAPGVFGVLEPLTNELVSPDEFDVMIVPLVAFDERCGRIGYGGGYYDRYLPFTHCPSIGLAFERQRIDDTMPEVHDHALDMIITETSIYHQI